MVKYPLSKEPIDAESSANELKKANKNLEEAFNSLKDSALSIKSNLEGEEFQGAANYIGKILEKINESSTNINDTLQKIANEVNEYNSQIVDADGNPYYAKEVNYIGRASNMNKANYRYGVNYNSYNIKDEIISNYKFNNQTYEVDSVFMYNNKKYEWNEVVNKFLNEVGYSNLINSVSINNNIASCYLSNGSMFVINNVSSFNDLKNGIIDYFSRNYL